MVNSPLRILRLTRGIPQRELAKKCHINNATISRYESGQIDPPLKTKKKIARFLGGVAVTDLWPEEPEAPESASVLLG